MKGIVLAGGSGTRLHPLTKSVSKQLLPVYDAPMIFYPLQTLKTMGVTEIAVITTPHDQEAFIKLLGDGSDYGLELQYYVQESPDGLAQAFVICADFIKGERVALILGDNVFAIPPDNLRSIEGNAVFLYKVNNPEQYGVARFNYKGDIIEVVEKPQEHVSNYAQVGLYVLDEHATEAANNVKKSNRGEYEIVDVINQYIRNCNITAIKLCDTSAWFDCGTIGDLHDCAGYVRALKNRTNLKISL